MSDTMRMTGLFSGMDTESVIESLVSVKSQKVTDLQNEQKKLEWTQTVWQELNSKIYSFYSKTLSNMRFTSDYLKKTTKVSDSTKASIIASSSAVNGTQTLKISSTAKAGYLTGAKISDDVTTFEGKQIPRSVNSDVQTTTTIFNLINPSSVSSTATIASTTSVSSSASTNILDNTDTICVTVGTTSVSVSANTTIESFISDLKDKGIEASYDNYTKKLTISTAGGDRTITASVTDSSGIKYISDDFKEALGLNVSGVTSQASYTSDSKLSSIASSLVGKTITVTSGKGSGSEQSTDITITSDMTISDFVSSLKSAGVNASFDETNQRFFISSTSTGSSNEFELTSKDSDGKSDNSALISLGIYVDASNKNGSEINKYDYESGSTATRVYAQDAIIELNGATFTSDTNTFSINGLTINVTDTTADDEVLTISTDTDYDGIYDMIKDFVSEYNEIINDIYQKYNADSARKYSMLTDDEKEAMTDDEIEEWEDKIKSALLRKDTTLQSLMSSLVNVINDSYGTDSNGNKLYLFSYGIETLGYFEADEDERYALHIAGDPDDENTSSDDDLLKAALASDPDTTVNFFTNLCKTLYSTLYDAMKSTDYSSIYKVYEDKRLQDEYDDYDDKISDAEDELSDYEDYWYDKFSSMETALANLQSTQSVVTSMLGS
jgi:flagellar hook-associated protein 2